MGVMLFHKDGRKHGHDSTQSHFSQRLCKRARRWPDWNGRLTKRKYFWWHGVAVRSFGDMEWLYVVQIHAQNKQKITEFCHLHAKFLNPSHRQCRGFSRHKRQNSPECRSPEPVAMETMQVEQPKHETLASSGGCLSHYSNNTAIALVWCFYYLARKVE